MADRVQVMKQEHADLGGDAADTLPFPAPIEPQEDMIEAAGYYGQDASNRDENVLIFRDGDDWKFQDVTNSTPVTLSDLIAGTGGLTETGHRVLRQLIHFIDNGPAEGFTSGAYRETTGTVFPTAVVWWESSSKLKKIVEKLITWTGVNATTIVWKVYDTDGTTVLATVTDVITYDGVFETSRTRTIA